MSRGLPWPVVAALALGTWAVVLAPVFLRYRMRDRRARVPASPGHPGTAMVLPQPQPCAEHGPYDSGPVITAPRNIPGRNHP